MSFPALSGFGVGAQPPASLVQGGALVPSYPNGYLGMMQSGPQANVMTANVGKPAQFSGTHILTSAHAPRHQIIHAVVAYAQSKWTDMVFQLIPIVAFDADAITMVITKVDASVAARTGEMGRGPEPMTSRYEENTVEEFIVAETSRNLHANRRAEIAELDELKLIAALATMKETIAIAAINTILNRCGAPQLQAGKKVPFRRQISCRDLLTAEHAMFDWVRTSPRGLMEMYEYFAEIMRKTTGEEPTAFLITSRVARHSNWSPANSVYSQAGAVAATNLANASTAVTLPNRGAPFVTVVYDTPSDKFNPLEGVAAIGQYAEFYDGDTVRDKIQIFDYVNNTWQTVTREDAIRAAMSTNSITYPIVTAHDDKEVTNAFGTPRLVGEWPTELFGARDFGGEIYTLGSKLGPEYGEALEYLRTTVAAWNGKIKEFEQNQLVQARAHSTYKFAQKTNEANTRKDDANWFLKMALSLRQMENIVTANFDAANPNALYFESAGKDFIANLTDAPRHLATFRKMVTQLRMAHPNSWLLNPSLYRAWTYDADLREGELLWHFLFMPEALPMFTQKNGGTDRANDDSRKLLPFLQLKRNTATSKVYFGSIKWMVHKLFETTLENLGLSAARAAGSAAIDAMADLTNDAPFAAAGAGDVKANANAFDSSIDTLLDTHAAALGVNAAVAKDQPATANANSMLAKFFSVLLQKKNKSTQVKDNISRRVVEALKASGVTNTPGLTKAFDEAINRTIMEMDQLCVLNTTGAAGGHTAAVVIKDYEFVGLYTVPQYAESAAGVQFGSFPNTWTPMSGADVATHSQRALAGGAAELSKFVNADMYSKEVLIQGKTADDKYINDGFATAAHWTNCGVFLGMENRLFNSSEFRQRVAAARQVMAGNAPAAVEYLVAMFSDISGEGAFISMAKNSGIRVAVIRPNIMFAAHGALCGKFGYPAAFVAVEPPLVLDGNDPRNGNAGTSIRQGYMTACMMPWNFFFTRTAVVGKCLKYGGVEFAQAQTDWQTQHDQMRSGLVAVIVPPGVELPDMIPFNEDADWNSLDNHRTGIMDALVGYDMPAPRGGFASFWKNKVYDAYRFGSFATALQSANNPTGLSGFLGHPSHICRGPKRVQTSTGEWVLRQGIGHINGSRLPECTGPHNVITYTDHN